MGKLFITPKEQGALTRPASLITRAAIVSVEAPAGRSTSRIAMPDIEENQTIGTWLKLTQESD